MSEKVNNDVSQSRVVGALKRKISRLERLLSFYENALSLQHQLIEITEYANDATELDVFYGHICDFIERVVQPASFYFAIEKSTQFHIETEFQYLQGVGMSLSTGRIPSGEAMLARQLIRENEAQIATRSLISSLPSRRSGDNLQSLCGRWLGVPVRRVSHAYGLLVVTLPEQGRHFSRREKELFIYLASLIMNVRTRLRLVRDNKHVELTKTEELAKAHSRIKHQSIEHESVLKTQQVLFDISALSVNSKSGPEFYEALYPLLNRLIMAENCYIAALNPVGEIAELLMFCDSKYSWGELSTLDNDLIEYVVTTRQAQLLDATTIGQLPDTQEHLSDELKQKQSWLCVPVIQDDRVMAVIVVQQYVGQGNYHQNDKSILSYIANHVAAAMVQHSLNVKLRENNDNLEQKIQLRTKALRKSNLFLQLQIEERKKAEERLLYEANHDALTGLPNRKMFLARLHRALADYKAGASEQFAVLFIDLDRFKTINDTIGHHAGDQFLIEVSQRISYCIREDDMLARLGGDEFVILVDQLQVTEIVEEIAYRIIEVVRQPFLIEGQDIYSGASIGIAVCKEQYEEAEEVLRDADAAMYQAKAMGKGRYILFDDSMRQQLIEELTLDQMIHHGIEQKQFFPNYAPVCDIEVNQVVGFKVETHWTHQELGEVNEEYFGRMAESIGVIAEIEKQIIEKVCVDIEAQNMTGGLVCLNVSAAAFVQPDYIHHVLDVIKAARINTQLLCFSFEESALIEHLEEAAPGIKRLKREGIKLSIHNVGSGITSLGVLAKLPVDFIEVDARFTSTLIKNQKHQVILEALVTLSRSLNFNIVLQGIDNEKLFNIAKQHSIFMGQGSWLAQRDHCQSASLTSFNDSDDDLTLSVKHLA